MKAWAVVSKIPIRRRNKSLAFYINWSTGGALNQTLFCHGPLALDGRVIQKISKCQFSKYQIFLQWDNSNMCKTSTKNPGARGVQSFCVLESPNCLLIEQLLTF